MNFKVDYLKVNELFNDGQDIYTGTRQFVELTGDELVSVDTSSLNIDGNNEGTSFVNQVTDGPTWKMLRGKMSIDETVYPTTFTQDTDAVILTANSFSTPNTVPTGTYVCVDKQYFGKVVSNDNGVVVLDSPVITTDVLKFLSPDTSKSDWTLDTQYGLEGALSRQNNDTIYMKAGEEIIIDAGVGSQIYIGQMTTLGDNYDPMLYTSSFDIYLSDDGVTWTLAYQNSDVLTTSYVHNMSGNGRFLKIVSYDEYDGWCRIRLDFAAETAPWNIQIKEPNSKVYGFSPVLKINNYIETPDYIETVDGVNWVVYDNRTVDTKSLVFNTYLGTGVQCDTWYEVEGLR